MEKFDENISFVARHWRPGAFSASAGWRRLGISRAGWARWRVAASIAAGTVLAASAIIYNIVTPGTPEPSVPTENITAPAPSSTHEIKRIEFDNRPIAVVAAEIEKVYGVKLGNVPDDDLCLSLSYEGTAADLVDTINDLLGTEIEIVGHDE